MPYEYPPPPPCSCGSGLMSEATYDGQRIFIAYTCPRCRDAKLQGYRPEILAGYDQSDVDEPIEEE